MGSFQLFPSSCIFRYPTVKYLKAENCVLWGSGQSFYRESGGCGGHFVKGHKQGSEGGSGEGRWRGRRTGLCSPRVIRMREGLGRPRRLRSSCSRTRGRSARNQQLQDFFPYNHCRKELVRKQHRSVHLRIVKGARKQNTYASLSGRLLLPPSLMFLKQCRLWVPQDLAWFVGALGSSLAPLPCTCWCDKFLLWEIKSLILQLKIRGLKLPRRMNTLLWRCFIKL